jgi:hypothetical protein
VVSRLGSEQLLDVQLSDLSLILDRLPGDFREIFAVLGRNDEPAWLCGALHGRIGQ